MKTILKKSAIFLFIVGMIIVSCKKDKDTSPPTTPGSLSVSDITSSTITLSWTASSDNEGVAFYNIYVNNNIFCSVFDATSYVVKDLLPLTSYSFKVEAVDAAGNISTAATLTVSTVIGEVYLSIFTSQVPEIVDYDGPYEMGMFFYSDLDAEVVKIRFYKHQDDTDPHTGNLWDENGTLLASVAFTNETAQGWQEATLDTPYPIEADVIYCVSVNTSAAYAWSEWALGDIVISNQFLHTVAGDNGTWGPVGEMPTNPWNGMNAFRDVVVHVGGD
jgi:hypothetical protein